MSRQAKLKEDQTIDFHSYLSDFKTMCDENSLFTVEGALAFDREKGKAEGTTTVYDTMKKKLPSLSSGSNKNIAVVKTKKELTQFLIYLINLSYQDKNGVDAKYYLEKVHAVEALNNVAFIKVQSSVAAKISTHNVKLSDPSADSVQIMAIEKEYENDSFVCGLNTPLLKEMEFGGNAAIMKASNLLSTDFFFEGRVISVFKALVADDQTILTAINAIAGKDVVSTFKTIITEALSSKNSISKLQLLVPTGQEEYVAISPVPSVGFSRMFGDKIYHFFNDQTELRTDVIVIGGSNPQNCGQFNSSIGGKHRTLKAVFPRFKKDKVTLLIKAYEQRKTLVRFSAAGSHELVQMNTEFMKQKKGFARCIKFWVSDVMKDFSATCKLHRAGTLEGVTAERLGDFERRLITRRLFLFEVKDCANYFYNILESQMDSDTRKTINSYKIRCIQKALLDYVNWRVK